MSQTVSEAGQRCFLLREKRQKLINKITFCFTPHYILLGRSNNGALVKFQALMTADMKMAVFWTMLRVAS
jgi:hypothetical protein